MKILAEDDTNEGYLKPETQPIPSMNNIQCLPILLVSAKDQDAVSVITSEIINTCQDDSPHKIMQSEPEYVWRLTNKYYTANIRVHALQDGELLDSQLADLVEAHLIYLTEDECDEEEVVRRRGEACASAAVQLVAAEAGAEPPRLAAACVRARQELVALREPGGDERGERDGRGVGRLRAALHAHLWPGLRRETHSDTRVPDDEEACDSSDSSWSEWCTGPAGDAGEEAYFAALASLPAAAAAARRAGGERDDREQRLARAEQLVAAFCRALGAPVE